MGENHIKKIVLLSVTDFAVPAPRRGSIDAHSGYSRGAQTGTEIHQLTQAKRLKADARYKAEVSISHTFETNFYKFRISGRMDGFFDRDCALVEEIKSSFNIQELAKKIKADRLFHPYSLQLQTYDILIF